ncbi:DUF3667 domain-containing protein [Novosphingopyxis sp. YJ-S2-01]|uniref:DUF3667 domain-containing protein n=1 Tax=Novosphingopyxis sp. YJ-S2-01 TaxID=2794021 RepID=UPI0018DB0B6D|nr:DUF3667 domain-containing protein [Novosphingopyxis sp. YJ-S2-01]
MNDERQTDLSEDGHTTETACLNCGTALIGSHCHACGQHAHVHRTLSALGHDFLHGVLHFEGAFWHSAPLLVWRPGELTRRYIDGERKRFVSPMALFLFAIFLMFVIFSFTGGPFENMQSPETDAAYQRESEQLDQKIHKDSAALKALPPGDTGRAGLEEALREEMAARNGIAMLRQEPMPYPEMIGVDERVGQNGTEAINTGSPLLDHIVETAAHKFQANPGLIQYKMQSNGYKFAWLLIPLSLPFIWLVTIGAKSVRFYDHAVFTTYSLSFMVLLFLALTLLGKAGVSSGLLIPIGLIFPPIHLYRQLRHAYGFSRLSTLLRLVVLLSLIPVIGLIFTFLLLGLGLAG